MEDIKDKIQYLQALVDNQGSEILEQKSTIRQLTLEITLMKNLYNRVYDQGLEISRLNKEIERWFK